MTLCSVNCGDQLIRFLIKRKHFSSLRIVWMYFLFFLNRLGLLSNRDGVRLSHELFKNMSLKEIEEITEECFQTVVKHSLFEDAEKAVEQYKSEGKKVFLASGSPSMIINKICQYLETESCVATEYSDNGDIITGIAEPICYSEGKVKMLEQRGLLAAPFILYTDDVSDLPLIKHAAHVYLVNPRQKLVDAVKSLNIPHEVKHWK